MERGQFWRCTLIEPATRLRVGRGIAKTETEASQQALSMLKQRSGCQAPPALVSDGWGGHREALVEVYGQVPPYQGRGRPPSKKRPAQDWQYMQVAKQRDPHGRLLGIETRVIYGDPDTLPAQLGEHTAYIERTHLTMRHMNGRLVRKSLGFSKRRTMLEAACSWEDVVYNFARHVKTLRLEVNDGLRRWLYRSPAMAARLADRIWTVEDLLLMVPVPNNP
jgi:hypothetical protein